MKYVIGNWKANKNLNEANQWIKAFLKYDLQRLKGKVTVIVCPPYPLIPALSEGIKRYQYIKVGSQDTSTFSSGSYTGEVTSKTLSGIISYVIIGHSERRKHFGEAEKVLFNKVEHAIQNDIVPVFCVRGPNDRIPSKVNIVAYEPVHAIGTGANEPVKKVLHAKEKLDLKPGTVFIYGGSVTANNASIYLKNEGIDGVLPGGASLDPENFYGIIRACL